VAETSEQRERRQAWWRRVSQRMGRMSERFGDDVRRLLRRDLDEGFYDDLLEVLLGADVGISVAEPLIATLRRRVREEGIPTAEAAMAVLREEMLAGFGSLDRTLYVLGKPSVVLIVGVNGNGKTTTIGKLAHRMREDGISSLVAAADTYRAAAIDQLRVWATRAGVDVVANQPGSDPAAVAFDAVEAAKARGVNAVLVDTAGRLHTKAPLMEELKKIKRVTQKAVPDGPHEILLVLEAPTGMNGLAQVKTFNDALGLTGLVMTKLDGSARGGTLLQIERETGVPVKLIGLGEGIDDLGFFDPSSYLDALFGGVLGEGRAA
jgi:fused signal recognition particle receptor